MCTEGGCGPDPCTFCRPLWVLLVSDELPWVRTTVANRSQDRTEAWLPHASDGAGTWMPACVCALMEQHWDQASGLRSWCTAELTKKPHFFCQPRTVKSPALFLREELWCWRDKGQYPLPLPLVWRAVFLLPPLTP